MASMQSSIKLLEFFVRLSLALLSALLMCAATAVADVRQDVETAVASLHCNVAAEKFTDDMKSLDLVYEVARRYYSNNERENADKFYLLALQKARIIESLLKMTEVPDVPAASDYQLLAGSVADETAVDQDTDRIVGSKGIYTVVKNDTIRLVAAKLGVTQQHLRNLNNLDAKAYLRIGQKLAYNNRKIIPQQIKNGIIINIPDRTLYYFQQGALVTSLPVALGSATKNDKYFWQTPVGKFRITAKMKDPTWTVPPSIKTEMEDQGKEVITSIPP